METTIGAFEVEDAFNLTGRGLVLVGYLRQGEVVASNVLAFENGTRWQVRAVNPLQYRTRPEIVGLLVTAPFTPRQELRDSGIIGGTALIFAL